MESARPPGSCCVNMTCCNGLLTSSSPACNQPAPPRLTPLEIPSPSALNPVPCVSSPVSVASSEYHAPRANEGLFAAFALTCRRPLSGTSIAKISFNQVIAKPVIASNTPSRRDTGEEVRRRHHEATSDTDTYIEVPRTSSDIALESTRTIEIDEFCPSRYRQPLSDPPVLSRTRRQGRHTPSGHPRNHPQHEQVAIGAWC